MSTVQRESKRGRACDSILLVSKSLVISGVTLAVSAMISSAFLKPGSACAYVFVGTTVVLVAIIAGRAATLAAMRPFADFQPQLSPIRSLGQDDRP